MGGYTMRMQYIKYYSPFKRYAWLVIDDKAKHHWFRYKLDANNFFKVESKMNYLLFIAVYQIMMFKQSKQREAIK